MTVDGSVVAICRGKFNRPKKKKAYYKPSRLREELNKLFAQRPVVLPQHTCHVCTYIYWGYVSFAGVLIVLYNQSWQKSGILLLYLLAIVPAWHTFPRSVRS